VEKNGDQNGNKREEEGKIARRYVSRTKMKDILLFKILQYIIMRIHIIMKDFVIYARSFRLSQRNITPFCPIFKTLNHRKYHAYDLVISLLLATLLNKLTNNVRPVCDSFESFIDVIL